MSRWAFLVYLVAANALAQTPTFNSDVAPILQRRCEPCHRPGGLAAMKFIDYPSARPWAKAIRDAVVSRKMPPWFRESGTLEFLNDQALTTTEIDSIKAWADGGAPEGDPKATPAPRSWAAAFVGSFKADLELSAGPFSIAPDSTLPYQYIVLPAGNQTDLWVQQVEIRPGARDVVHHVVAYVREPDDPWLKGAPRARMHVPPLKDRQTKADILAVYTPGARSVDLPEGMAKKLPAGSDIVLQFHYTPGKSRAIDHTRIALRFAKTPPTKRVLTLQIGQDKLDIPPYERNYRASASGTLPNDALLLSLMPHMHLRGAAFDFDIVGEKGRVETLLRVKPFDFHWQLTYWLKTPRPLPKGTRLRFTGYFDNSANNPRNPNPADNVGWGEQSWQEMMIGFFDVAVDPSVDKKLFFVR